MSYKLFKYDKLLLLRKQCCNNGAIYTKFIRKYHEFATEIPFSNGTTLTLSSGKYARLSNGTAVATLGDTSVMVTAVSREINSMMSHIPLTVEYRQKAAAAGRIPTNFLRREMGMTESEVLKSRLIDRSLRPLFTPEGNLETQIICNMLAVDGINDPDIVAINAASAALSLSDIPWNGPVAAARVGMINDELKLNPTRQEMQQSELNLVITITKNHNIVMLEGFANDIPRTNLKKAIKHGVKECQNIISSIQSLQEKHGKEKMKLKMFTYENEEEMMVYIKNIVKDNLQNILTNFTLDKLSRDSAISRLRDSTSTVIKERFPTATEEIIKSTFYKVVKDILRSLILENNIRCDGRKEDDVRDISSQVDLFKPLHGSALFQRGQTQVLCTVTLDSVDSALKMDMTSMLISGMKEKNFFLHYEFPPYATREVGRVGYVGRRELGHGALAEKGLKSVIPKNYPFTIRLTSEVLESNGSSSMASICGGSLALMDAGVPISSPVAGVAMGLVTKSEDGNPSNLMDYKILTDITGMEDYYGDMDFKIAGGKNGFTVLQADIKLAGISQKIVFEVLNRAEQVKLKIIGIMEQTLSEPRKDLGDKMPVLEDLEIPIHQRGQFLGIGGSNLKKLYIETGVYVYHKQENVYTMFAPNKDALQEAKAMITAITEKDREPLLEFGAVYTAKIVEIRETGVMVILYSNMIPTLLPLSQLDQRKVFHPDALGLKVGQELKVKYFGRDPVSGYMRLSRKVLQEPNLIAKTLS